MSLENALNNLTDELKRRRSTEGTDAGNADGGGDSSHDEISHDDHPDDYAEHDFHEEHDDCTDADGDGHCDSDDGSD